MESHGVGTLLLYAFGVLMSIDAGDLSKLLTNFGGCEFTLFLKMYSCHASASSECIR